MLTSSVYLYTSVFTHSQVSPRSTRNPLGSPTYSASPSFATYTPLHLCVDVFFFFSSRRRHTRLVSDWSSDVCSSDLERLQRVDADLAEFAIGDELWLLDPANECRAALKGIEGIAGPRRAVRAHHARSEERRVGKEGRSRGARER